MRKALVAQHEPECAIKASAEVDALAEATDTLEPPARKQEDGAEGVQAEGRGARVTYPACFGKRLPDQVFYFGKGPITVQVILPQSEVGIEGLVGVEAGHAERMPFELEMNAALPIAHGVAG